MPENASSEVIRAVGRLEGKLDSMVAMVAELRGDFENMERGRLSKLEVEFATVRTNLSSEMKWNGTVTAIGASIVGSVITGIILYLVIPHAG